jgi:hypothetical protein
MSHREQPAVYSQAPCRVFPIYGQVFFEEPTRSYHPYQHWDQQFHYQHSVSNTAISRKFNWLFAQALDYQNSPFLQDAGITVNPDPISVNGYILLIPSIYYGNAASNKLVVWLRRHETSCNDALILNPSVPRNGSWNVVNQQIYISLLNSLVMCTSVYAHQLVL